MKGDDGHIHWYAMKVTYGRVLKARNILTSHSIDTYVPMKRKYHQTNGKVKSELIPAISNLLFIKATYEQVLTMKLKVSYMVNMLTKDNNILTPIIVPGEQMERFITTAEGNYDYIEYLNYDDIDFHKGERVKITSGKFKGYEGLLVDVRGKENKQVVVTLEGLFAIALVYLKII